jgi:hypothetical protein
LALASGLAFIGEVCASKATTRMAAAFMAICP